MGAYQLVPVTWDGHDIRGMQYEADFTEGGETRNTLPGSAVEVSIPGTTPKHVRVQPDGLRFDLELEIKDTFSQARLDELKSWFSPLLKGERELIATDGDSVDRVADCVCERLEVLSDGGRETVQIFVAHMRNAAGVWRAVTEDSASQAIDAATPASLTWDLTDKGSTPAPLALTLTPSAAKDPGDSWPNRRRIAFANLAPEALGDHDVYAVKLCNLTTESIAKIGDTWDHVRVLIYGEYVDRWITTAGDVWINYRWNPRKIATLAANINDSVDLLSVSNADGFARDVWPESQGFFKIGDEAIFYSAERTAKGLSGLIRGVLGTTAASHTAGDQLAWIEHYSINLLSGFTAAPDPQPDDDRKPLLDLDTSENDSHVYGTEGLTARGTRRSMQFAMRSSDTGVGAQHTRQFDDTGVQTWENNLPAAGKPALNEASRLFPVPLTGIAAIDIDVGLPMLLRGYVEDTEGYETRLIDEDYTATPLTAQAYALPGNVRKLRLVGGVGVVVGNLNYDSDLGWEIDSAGTLDVDHPEIELLEEFQATAVKFPIVQDTKVTGVIVKVGKASGASGDLGIAIMEDGGGAPEVDVLTFGATQEIQQHVIASLVIPNADLAVDSTAFKFIDLGPLQLSPGTYWLSYLRNAGDTGLMYTAVGPGGFATRIAGNFKTADDCITFGIVSDETEPQDDAPLDGGETITVANVTFPLDSTLAPWIKVGAEEDFYLLEATLSNAAIEYLTLRFPMRLATGLDIDTGTRRITDQEFGIDVPWARQDSSQTWPHAAPVDETLTWEEDGALLTVDWERRAEYL